ncbi:rho guanine nucleotide exchange factor 5 [Lacerta agilis]|uniref:rho guanine nucleotide exchange factor 5 n=1 Tax=Lacerta agilis TaxID=80427 RepID=UPI001419D18A|nr:rho guanine nucleotide exchange factor 5 [Lacerta agilis]
MCITGFEQMGYKGTTNRMHRYRRRPKKDVPLMESEKIKGEDPFPSATHKFNESSNPAPARRHHDVTEFFTRSDVSEERVTVTAEDKKGSFSQALPLLFVMEEEIWGRFPNPVERETSVGLERGQRDPEDWGGFSKQENLLNIQEVTLDDNKEAPLDPHQRELEAAHSLSDNESSLFSTATLEQISSVPSEVAVGEIKGETLVLGFPQALNPRDAFSQTLCEETHLIGTFSPTEESGYDYPLVSHGVSEHHQNAEPCKGRSDENHSSELESQYEPDKSHMPNMEVIWEMDEKMSSKTEGPSQMHLDTSIMNEEGKVRELKGQREGVKSSALFQLSFEFSKGGEIHLDVQQPKQPKPNEILCLPDSNRVDNNSDIGEEVEESGQNSFICTVLHLEEEDGIGGSKTRSLKETVKTKHATDCGEGESSQVSKSLESRASELEPTELGDTELNEECLEWKGMEKKVETEQNNLELGHKGDEQQDCCVQIRPASQQGGEREITAPLGLNALQMNLDLPGLNKNCSLVEAEAFNFTFKELSSPNHSPKSVWTQDSGNPQIAKARAMSISEGIPVCGSPRAQAPTCHDSRQLESSGVFDQVGHNSQGSEQLPEVDRSAIEREDSEYGGEEISVVSLDGEGRPPPCRDLVVTPDSQMYLYDSQPVDHPVDGEIHITASSLGTSTEADSLEEGAGKRARDGTVVPCEESESTQEPENQNPLKPCQLNIMDCGEVLSGDADLWASSKNGVPGKDLCEVAQGTASEILQSIPSGEGLSNADRQSVGFSPDPESFQAQDTTVSYLETPMRSLEVPEKEEGADTLCMEQQTLIRESPCSLVLEEDGTACGNTESPFPPGACSVITPDMAQPTPTPASDQAIPPAPASGHLNQLTPTVSDYRESAQFLSPAPNADILAPAQLLEQLPSPSQACQFLAPKSTAAKAPQSSVLTPDNELFNWPPATEYNSNQHPLHSDSVFPALSADQPIQQANSSQTRESVAPEFNSNPTAFAVNRDLQHPHPASSSNMPPAPDGDQFAQQPVEAPESALPINYIDGGGCVFVADCISRTISYAAEAEKLAQAPNTGSRVEEFPVVQLANSEGAGTSQGQKGRNIDEASSLLVTHSDVGVSGDNEPVEDSSFSIPDTMDMCDGKSSNKYSLHPSVRSQKMSEAAEARSPMQPSLIAFTNPIHFFQRGPPSPPTIRHPSREQAVCQAPHWWQQAQRGDAKRDAEDTVPPAVPRKEGAARHLPLEKCTSCPDKSVLGVDAKVPTSSSKKQEVLSKHRAKSKDWHRQGLRKVSIPTDNELEFIASLISSREEAPAHKEKPDHFDRAKFGERKLLEAAETIKRRRSKLINSSKLLYQEYSDVALNKAIQNQKRADSLTEDLEFKSADSPRLRRKAISPQDSYLQRLSVSSTTSLWQDIPMVRESTVLLSMTREEQKLQEAKFELIVSEASYLRSLNVAVDHFQHCHELQAVLTNQDKQWLFSRLQDVRDVSANFLFDLEEKLEENMFTFNVCDVALRHAPEFRRVYLPYVTNQTYQEQTFRRLLNDVPAFQQVLEKLESDPVCQRLSLKSFLILPFQRITRLKLLLQNILKRTRPGADEELQATQAYDALEKLIKDCNENVQRMRSTEELIYLSKNMEFECKIFPLISQSRRLVKSGELTALEYNLSLKWKLTTRPIHLHLFNDYLLLSRPRENGRFIVFDFAASSNVRGEKCEMKLHGSSKNLFRLFLLQNNQGKKVEFLFRTETQSEKLRWISALMPQQTEPDLLDDPALLDKLQVQCVRPYKARENDELALEKADIIMVLQQSSDGWFEGVKLSDGERGWFPSDQVEIISSKQARQMNLKEEQRVKYAKQQVFHKR